jgi:hypothetical protein
MVRLEAAGILDVSVKGVEKDNAPMLEVYGSEAQLLEVNKILREFRPMLILIKVP